MTAAKIADLHHRFGAFIVDWHIRTVPIALWGFWILAKWFPVYWAAPKSANTTLAVAWETLQPVLHQPGVAFIGWLCVLAYLLYHPLIELVMHGDSPGKRMMGITVITVNGSRPDARQVLIRNLWRAIEFLPFAYLWGMWTISRSPENARLGDHAAGTRVVMRH